MFIDADLIDEPENWGSFSKFIGTKTHLRSKNFGKSFIHYRIIDMWINIIEIDIKRYHLKIS